MTANRPASVSLPGHHMKCVLVSVAKQAERDIALMLSDDAVARVHALRVRMKKLNALLPLIESRVKPPTMEAIRRNMRSLKQAVAMNRDQHVVNALLIALHEEESVRCRRKAKIVPATEPEPPLAKADLLRMKATARLLVRQIRRLQLGSLTWHDVADAFAGCFGIAKRRHGRCRQKHSSKRMHRWRKPVKDHYFQSLLLLRDWRHCKHARRLASILGKLHDFALLEEHLDNGMSV